MGDHINVTLVLMIVFYVAPAVYSKLLRRI